MVVALRVVGIDLDKCVSCGMCVAVCPFGAITDTSKISDVAEALRVKEQPMVAIVAPSLPGQFGPKATPGHIKTAILKLGFDGVVEAALGADVVAKQEAEEIRSAHVLPKRLLAGWRSKGASAWKNAPTA